MADYDAIILGGGAAGLFCAMEAAKRGRRVVVLERSRTVGAKILISGGGRCNFTNLHCRPENFLSANPHFVKSALALYRPRDFIALVEKHHIPYHEKTLGQLFCDRSARDILGMLRSECASGNVRIVEDCAPSELRRTTEFVLATSRGEFRAPALVVATGGLSIPRMGATSYGYDLAQRFGLKVIPCRPALVPLCFGRKDARDYGDLSGVSTEVTASTGRHSFREKMLFTHRGLSGPAILQISSYWKPGESIDIDLAAGVDVAAGLSARKARGDKVNTKNVVSEFLPRRLADRWFELHGPSRSLPETGSRQIHEIAAGLHRWTIEPAGDEGYDKAEVTAGGVSTDELSSRTMEAKQVRGLYFIGEVVDVTGQLGGFNFQWAWASGYAAGQSL
ncbi:MAG: NAD(P)/FAD-dependent oxidoreductase [Bryobacteraceae bacterium]